jgi:hypothetical protein
MIFIVLAYKGNVEGLVVEFVRPARIAQSDAGGFPSLFIPLGEVGCTDI